MKKLMIPLVLLLVVFAAGCVPGGPSCIPSVPAINSFSASPSSISAGESATLNWSVAGATMVSIDQGIGNVALTGNRVVSPGATTIYTLTAASAVGSFTATAQVIVSGAAPPIPTPTPTPTPTPIPGGMPVVNYFTPNPPVISAGGSTILSWSVSNATAVDISPSVGSVGASGNMTVLPFASTNYTLTATNAAGWRSVTITVVVASAPPPPAFTVTNVTASVSPPSFTGACPKAFNFVAVITTNGPGVVTYKWERSDGAMAPTQSIAFPAAGSQVVTTTWTLGADGSHWERLHILAPNNVVSNQASFTLTCGVPFAVTGVTASVAPPSFVGACPKAFNFSAVITTNGPGTVTYKWERSDGAMAPTQSITFPAAGSQTVGTTWTLGASGSHWERLHILAPNDVVSNQASFTLNCVM